MNKLALQNNGFMKHIYEAADASKQLKDFYRQISSPLLVDVQYTYPKDKVMYNIVKQHFKYFMKSVADNLTLYI